MTEVVTLADIANAQVAADEVLFERRMRALTLRNAGATYRQIAEKTGVSAAAARKDVAAALREVVAEAAEDMIARQRAVLMDIQRANYAAAASGDIDAARLIIATLEREARLFGLDAPTRVNVGVSDVEFAERTATLIESLGLRPPKELIRMRADDRAEHLDAEVILPFDLGGDSDEPSGVPTADGDASASSDGWSNI